MPYKKSPAKTTASNKAFVTQPQFVQSMAKIDERFKKVDKRFDEIDERFKKVDKRFDEIDERFKKVDKRFDEIDERFDRIDERFDKVEDGVHSLGVQFEDLDSKMDQLLEVCAPLLEKTTDHGERITKLEAQAPYLTPPRR